MITKPLLEQFRDILKRAFQQYNSDYINDKLKFVISSENSSKLNDETEEEKTQEPLNADRIVTTEEELQGFYIVKSILHGKVDLNRIVQRDTISYFGILLDDNNRKPICRLHFNSGKKYVETFDSEKKGTKYLIESLEDIYNISEHIQSSLANYINEN